MYATLVGHARILHRCHSASSRSNVVPRVRFSPFGGLAILRFSTFRVLYYGLSLFLSFGDRSRAAAGRGTSRSPTVRIRILQGHYTCNLSAEILYDN
jgi:hypothetical protein